MDLVLETATFLPSIWSAINLSGEFSIEYQIFIRSLNQVRVWKVINNFVSETGYGQIVLPCVTQNLISKVTGRTFNLINIFISLELFLSLWSKTVDKFPIYNFEIRTDLISCDLFVAKLVERREFRI